MTAGGVVDVPMFELRELSVAGRTFEAFEVLALDDLPAGVDGLLGMDVLDGFSWPGTGAAPR
jgi:hypothetical protein|tara:strand:- start:583 stop:768 length:186 start_codon:yes stop_codon:yes gene_type:complete